MQLSVIPTLKSYIPLNEFLALRLLYKEGNHIVSEIAEHMHISNSSMTCVSDRLMEREFVTRVRSQKTAALSTYRLRIKEKRLQKKWKKFSLKNTVKSLAILRMKNYKRFFAC